MRVKINVKSGLSEIELHQPDVRTLESALQLARAIEKHGDDRQARAAGNAILELLTIKQLFGLIEAPSEEEAA